jgi:23S rRNA (uracil-5-)-methyltransferase RumA
MTDNIKAEQDQEAPAQDRPDDEEPVMTEQHEEWPVHAEPKCRYFGKCGGCSAQHIYYQVQLENKQRLMADSVKLPVKDVAVFSGEPYAYRNRMDFIFHKKGLGFRKKGRWYEIVDIETCSISNARINELLAEVRKHFRNADHFDVKKKTGTFRYAVIRTPQEDSAVSFVLNPESSRLTDAVEKIKKFAENTTADNVVITYVPPDTDTSVSDEYFVVKGKDTLHETYQGMDFEYSVQGFFQNNHAMADQMVGYVKELLTKYTTQKQGLLDLYGGVGSFGIVCSDLFYSTTIVESVSQCIEAAKKNIKENGIKNAEAVLLDARYLKRLDIAPPIYVITDPPRSGMHPDTISALNRLKPKAIIYISCNIQQLGRDLPKFREYTVKSTAIFDLFPQTPHCEGVVELARKKQE